MSKKRAFLSFIEEDKAQVQGLRLLAANPNFDLEFFDESVRVPMDSRDADYIKQRIREKINRTSVTVCLISGETYKSKWVDWELQESDQKGNTIIAMALKGIDNAVLPRLIKEKGLTFHAWDPQRLNDLGGKQRGRESFFQSAKKTVSGTVSLPHWALPPLG